jgi:hypothetical protein
MSRSRVITTSSSRMWYLMKSKLLEPTMSMSSSITIAFMWLIPSPR